MLPGICHCSHQMSLVLEGLFVSSIYPSKLTDWFWDITVAHVILPSVPSIQSGIDYIANDQINQRELILNGSGRKFLVLHKAGGSGQGQPVDDPIFAAHNEIVVPNEFSGLPEKSFSTIGRSPH